MVPVLSSSTICWLMIFLAAASVLILNVDTESVENGCKDMLPFNGCHCSNVEIKCINLQHRSDEIFLQIGVHFPYLEKIEFVGNTISDIPANIFGIGQSHDRLKDLNLSANYIMNLDRDAFTGMANLKRLDLSRNEIHLKPEGATFLNFTRRLEELYMQKAFPQPLESNPNATSKRLEIFQRGLEQSHLNRLHWMDLSWNFITYFPRNFICALPALKTLILENNYLETLDLNPDCVKNLVSVDLRGNMFVQLDLTFRLSAQALPKYGHFVLSRNNFQCDCNSRAYLDWVKMTTSIKDVDLLRCVHASPSSFKRTRLIDVDPSDLDCSTLINYAENGAINLLLLFLISSSSLFFFFFNRNA